MPSKVHITPQKWTVNPTKITSEMEFAVMIATNRGANYRLFSSVPEAEEWLMAGIKTFDGS